MKVFIDGRTFAKPGAGITTFLRCSICAWANIEPHYQFIVLLTKDFNKDNDSLSFPPNVKLIRLGFFFNHLPNLLSILIAAPYLVRKHKADVFYAPIPFIPFFLPHKIKTLIVVHDVVNIEYSKTIEFKNKISTKFFCKRSIKRAFQIWTNSYYTKEKVEKYFPIRKCTDIIVGASIDRNVYKQIYVDNIKCRLVKDKYGIKDKFIIFVGSLEPRKNIPFLLKIIPSIYRKTGVQLVIVGAKGWKNSVIREIYNSEEFPKESTIFCGYISNEELAIMYNIAECFVSASYNEGFGMPQLEAQLCGCPVITSDNSAMRELSYRKSGAILIKGYNEDNWEKKIIMFLKNRPLVNLNEYKDFFWENIMFNVNKSINQR